MTELLYEDMILAQAADALDEFITERPAALERLCTAMTAHGLISTRCSTGPWSRWAQCGSGSPPGRPSSVSTPGPWRPARPGRPS